MLVREGSWTFDIGGLTWTPKSNAIRQGPRIPCLFFKWTMLAYLSHLSRGLGTCVYVIGAQPSV